VNGLETACLNKAMNGFAAATGLATACSGQKMKADVELHFGVEFEPVTLLVSKFWGF